MGSPQQATGSRAVRAAGVDILAPLRAAVRFTVLLAWCLLCRGLIIALAPLAWVAPEVGRRARRRIARMWLPGMTRIMGIRVTVHGSPPEPPFFVVLNHMAWIDLFPITTLCDATYIVEEPVSRTPIIGGIVAALEPIFVRRVKADTARVNDEMVKVIESGGSIVMAPETPLTTILPGSGVRMFRGGLLASAVRTGMPVHWVSLTYRTAPTAPPAHEVMLYGPNPYYTDESGKIPDSEIAMWGPERSFLWHALRLLSIPWCEIILRFGDEPIPAGDDRIALANRLHDAVEEAFVPLR